MSYADDVNLKKKLAHWKQFYNFDRYTEYLMEKHRMMLFELYYRNWRLVHQRLK